MYFANNGQITQFMVYLVNMEYQIELTDILKTLVKCFDKNLKSHSHATKLC